MRCHASSRALTGAWIETSIGNRFAWLQRVAPSRARGLKLCRWSAICVIAIVAPSRARGLKRVTMDVASPVTPLSRPHGRVD